MEHNLELDWFEPKRGNPYVVEASYDGLRVRVFWDSKAVDDSKVQPGAFRFRVYGVGDSEQGWFERLDAQVAAESAVRAVAERLRDNAQKQEATQ